jgi:hypothetical protein
LAQLGYDPAEPFAGIVTMECFVPVLLHLEIRRATGHWTQNYRAALGPMTCDQCRNGGNVVGLFDRRWKSEEPRQF